MNIGTEVSRKSVEAPHMMSPSAGSGDRKP
jgi:hypothetical protein